MRNDGPLYGDDKNASSPFIPSNMDNESQALSVFDNTSATLTAFSLVRVSLFFC